MAVQTVQTTGDVPKVLEPFYLGKPAVGTPGKPGYKAAEQGLIERGIAQLFPAGKTGTEAFKSIYGDVFKAGLMGEGAVAPMSTAQNLVGERLETMGLPTAFTQAQQAGKTAIGAYGDIPGVTAPQLTQFQMAAPTQVAGGQYTGPQMTAAQMTAPQQFTGEAMQQYMDPYMQGVVDIQQRKAIEAAQQAQLGQNLAAARQGTYGGARQALVQAQREAGLRTQLGDIQATGLQSAFQQAQQQFERDRAATMQSQLANLTNQQQAAVQNQAAALQAQGLTAQQAMQAALANQQAGLTTSQQNLQAALGVQQLGAGQSLEAQRANQAAQLQGAAGLAGLAGTMGQIGTQQLAGELDITKTIGAYGDLQRALAQQERDAERQMLMDQAQYGQTQVGQLSNLLRGIPLSDTTQQTTTPPPSFASQLTGLGLTGLGLYNMLGQPNR